LLQLKDQASALAAMKISLSEEQEANEVLKEQKAGLMKMVVRTHGHSRLSYLTFLPAYISSTLPHSTPNFFLNVWM
jgi:hypothetical protein